MLPPFVPPSARAQSESLPLITEFVVDRVERSFESSTRSPDSFESSEAEGSVATLPSIDEFKIAGRRPPASEADEFVQRTSRSAAGTYEAAHIAPANSGSAIAPSVPSTIGSDLLPREPVRPAGTEDAIVNEIAEPAERWEASAAGVAARDRDTGERANDGVGEASQPQPATEEWIAQERDAFDWHGVASLAVPPAEEARAAEEWSSTEWDKSGGSVEDHVSGILSQLGRRIRSGDLEVNGSRQMGVEATLVSVLAALLAEASRNK